jgi:hypothetical protein
MVRESLAPGSRFVAILATSANGWRVQRRLTTGDGVPASTVGPTGVVPGWVRLTRVGNVITASQSVDGIKWTLVATDTLVLPATVYVGLAVTSHNPGALSAATFTNVVVGLTGGPSAPTNVRVLIGGE